MAKEKKGLREKSLRPVWLPVFYDYYEVSHAGEVRRADSKRLLKKQVTKTGYEKVGLSVKRRVYSRFVHRLAASVFLGRRPPKKEVNHKDGNKRNNNCSNLEYLTRTENIRHSIKLGLRKTRGEDNPNSKITWKLADEIRSLRGLASTYSVAKRYSVSQGTVWKIFHGFQWNRQAKIGSLR